MKKLLCIILAATVVGTLAPADITATAVDDEAAASTETAQTDGSDETADNGLTVLENGEVVQEGAVGTIDQSEWITIDDYELVAESDTYKMYYYEPRLSIILENKKTGKLMESTLSDEKDDGTSNATWNAYMKSGVVISAIKGTTNTYQADMITCKNEIHTTYTDNGISAEIYFDQYQFGLTVEISLEDDELVVNVPDESIVEDQEGTYISTVSLFPFMGYTHMDEQEGYMLIPDGNGALIYLDDKEGRFSTGFSQMIYGKDTGFTDSTVTNLLWERYDTVIDANQVIAPIFGMAHSDDELGYLAVVEDGDTRASIEAHPNGVMVNYNRCFAKFLVRDIYVQPLNNSDSGTVTNVETDRVHTNLTVRYMLLDSEDADYSGMAVSYRNYLLDHDVLTAKDTSYKTRVDFLGTDREEWLLFTRAVTMTTTDDISNIYSELQDNGVESVLSVYKGWQKGGLYDVPISKYKADSHIGGTSSLTDLITDSASVNYSLYLYNDALRINPDENNSTFNVVKKVNKRTYKEESRAQVYDTFEYLTPAKTTSLLEGFVQSYTKEGVSNLAVAGISDNLYSYTYKSKFYSRQDCATTYTDLIATVDEDANLLLEQPFEYLWQYTDAFLDMPLGSSDYMYEDEEVPFLSMVLKGIMPMYSDYVNFEANKTEFFLQMVESGVYPSFYVTQENSSALIYTNSADLYSTEYNTYKDTIIDYDAKLREVAAAVDGACIVDHEKLDSGVTRVTYDNGVAIYVNYTDDDVTEDGITVPAMSYKVGDAQ